jgi:SAM-dependent methyltransferase
MSSSDDTELHSGAYFDPVRDYWWNLDHLELIAARLQMEDVRSVLDVVAGVGHWGRVLAAVLSEEVTVVGVDREPGWVSEATRLAEKHGLAGRFSYSRAVAEDLPFTDASFDLVTCQTLLIHVPDPQAVLREMLRVTRPGGLVLLAEPNNFASLAIGSSAAADSSITEIIDRLQFALTCERGKQALGEGNISVGDLLPGYLAEAGATQIQTFTSDKTSTMFPPYESDEQHALRTVELEAATLDQWIWPKAQAKRYFLAGGGTPDRFDVSWSQRLQENQRTADSIAAALFHTAGGVVHYVAGGRRPQRFA